MLRPYPNSSPSLNIPREFNFISNREFSFFIDEIHLAIKAMEAEKKSGTIVGGSTSGRLVHLQNPTNLVVIGDIHGDLDSLLEILRRIEFRQFLSNQNNKMIFLGDYIDRGSDSAGVLQTLCHLKRKYPDSVVLLAGNHEAIERFPFVAHDLPKELDSKYGIRGRTIYEKLLLMFRLLPIAVTIEGQMLLIHGGVPIDTGHRTFFETIIRDDDAVAEELLWNDPRSDIKQSQDWCVSRRGLGKHFGKSITKKYLDLTGTKVLVRGHEPCHGFRLDHDDTVLTLFSSKEAYQKFAAAYIHVTKHDLEQVRNAADLAKYVQKI